jgi:sec-independent protein translocase protein TatA
MLVSGPFGLGIPELLIILAVVLLIFGASRLADIGGAMGKSIREFRKASREEDDEPAPSEPVAQVAPKCSNCGADVAGLKFCSSCGAPTSAAVN